MSKNKTFSVARNISFLIKLKEVLLILILFISTHAVCGQTLELTKFENKDFTFKYPSDWEFDDSGATGSLITVLSMPDDADDMFRENVNLIVQDISAFDVTLADYAEVSIPELEGAGAEILKSTTFQNPARHEVVFNIEQNGYDLRMIQNYLVENGNAYVLTLICLRSGSDKYWEIGQKILESFTVKHPKADKKLPR